MARAAVWLALAAACRAPSWPPGGVTTQLVAIENHAGAHVVARCDVDGDGNADAVEDLGDGAAIVCELPCAVWWLDATLGACTWQLPLPLVRAAVRPDRLQVTIAPPPDEPPLPGFVWIPAGPALVGDALGIGQEDERPARVVPVAGFWLAAAETTNAEYARFLDACGDAVDAQWLALDSRKCRIRRGADGRWHTDAPELPVVTVSHDGAVAYCAQRTAATGRRHRLPTEVEWEKAARGPKSFLYAYGDVYRPAAANQQSGELRPVGTCAPNGFGVVDLTGNAFEWVADVYVPEPADRADAARAGGAPGDGPYRVLRGGSFVLDGIYLRNSMRMKLRPGTRADDVGFRVVIDGPSDAANERERR